ncbi:hypothetical protein B0A58_00200 [Flavobacterium branchiophilum NBRC 15030 = ATCC 35035]|uniref:Uncharacterized protein n=1 Tax=Flavobacterium branchiophilum TaxID=55197 RepID=A0A543G6U2_9FLAO|nr:hypothetical protein [Flavobacterium branchiophilum]OXA82331.1 hypothetical protein B0A58_00200 [Flavobacterium branchiophilum NBRC 15030 = ATCC 35035]TQM41803.1 hypothetical protein BC670_2813 [Flavobacterium branchiophilum]GEM56366.1 hypothetical protein FB1_25870 [Flavobacterium branchiophilum NBRC 15030 = ATCC 35035]
MGNKIITEKDFWMCTGGNVPAQLQSIQLSTKKKDGKKYITLVDTATSSMMDFGCNKLMLIMAIVAAVIAVCVVATGGAALIAIGALAGAAGAAVGAVMGGLICGQIAAMARIWTNSKSNMIVQGKPAITGDHQMQCMLFGDKITFAPNIKNWWQAITVGAINTTAKIVEGALFGAMVGMGAGLLKGLTQLAMPTATSIGVNIIGSFGTLGSSVRAVFGIQNATHTWAMGSDLFSTETGEAFFDGAIPEYESIKRIGTGNAELHDAMLLLYLLKFKTPTPKEKPVTEEPVKNNTLTEPEPIKKKGDGEAFEAEPIKPTFKELKNMAENTLDFSTVEDGAVFWSDKNMRTAQKWAESSSTGKTTLEQTKGGEYLDNLDLFNPKNGLDGSQAAEVWDTASKRFAEQAKGEINVFDEGAERYGPYGERTWWRVEKPILEANKNVSGIKYRNNDGSINNLRK